MARSTKGLYKRGPVWWMTWRDATGRQRFESSGSRNQTRAAELLTDRRNEVLRAAEIRRRYTGRPQAEVDQAYIEAVKCGNETAVRALADAGLVSEAARTYQPELPPPRVLLEEFLERYLTHVSHQRGVETKRLHCKHLTRLLGNVPLHTLTPEVVDRYRETRRAEPVRPDREGREPAPRIACATINREIATLKDTLSKAVRWGMLKKEIRESLAGVEKYKEPPGRLRYLRDEAEAERLLEHCRGMIYRKITVAALHTGMRKAELLSLTWERVDLRNGFMHLTETKNGKARHVPINATLRAELAGLRTRLDCPWVFHDDAGRRMQPRFKWFEAAVRRAGLAGFRFHDLRHTFASWLVMRGVPLATVSELLGHQSLTMTMRYAHLSPRHMTEAVRVLDRDPAPSLDNYLTIRPREGQSAAETGNTSQAGEVA